MTSFEKMSSMVHFNDDDDDEGSSTSFLQDQVRRLTAVVREYQRRYLPIDERIIKNAPLEPWMSDQKLLSPLLLEYDSNITELKQQVEDYKVEFHKLKDKSSSIVEENDRLHRELRNTVENQINAIRNSDGLGNQAKLHIDQMQQKLKMANEEKDQTQGAYEDAVRTLETMKNEQRTKMQQFGSLTSELDMLQDDLNKARIFAEGLRKANQRLKLEHEQFLKTAQLQDSEMDDLRAQNRKLNGELKTLKSLIDELQSHNNKLEEQFKYLDKGVKSELITEKSAEGTIRKLRNEIVELDSRVVSYSKELGKLRVDKTDLEEQLAAIQKKNTSLEENEYQAILRVRDSVQLVENALLEREQAVVREQQKGQEVNRLQEALNNVLHQADEQRKQEVATIRSQHNKKLQEAIEELHSLEIENAELQAAFEKLRREKNSLENELEKLHEEGPEEVAKASFKVDELQKRLSKVELGRDEALLQTDTLQATLRRSKSRWENDRSVYLNQCNDAKKQIKALKIDLDQMATSRLELLDEVKILKKELQMKAEDNANIDMSCASQVSSLQQALEIKEREYESRLRATENMNKDAMNELREMLTLQQKNASKWRDESRMLCQKFESTITQLRMENSSWKRKNDEVLQAYKDLQNKYEEIEKEYQENQIIIDKLKRLLEESEERANAASIQVQTLLSRERQLLGDRKSLNRDLDKLRLEMSRSNKYRTVQQQWDTYIDNATTSKS